MSLFKAHLLPSGKEIDFEINQIQYAETGNQYVKFLVIHKGKLVWATFRISMHNFRAILEKDTTFDLNSYCLFKLTAFKHFNAEEKKNKLILNILKKDIEIVMKHKVSKDKLAHLRDKFGL